MRNLAAIVAAIAVLFVFSPGDAQARTGRSYYYAFGEFDHFSTKGGSLNGAGLGFGWRPGRYLAFQFGGQYLRDSTVDFYNLYGEALAIAPLSSSMSVYASLGLAYGRASALGTSSSGSGYRAGVGLNYWLTQEWGFRAGFHRQNVLGVSDDYSAGITYRF